MRASSHVGLRETGVNLPEYEVAIVPVPYNVASVSQRYTWRRNKMRRHLLFVTVAVFCTALPSERASAQRHEIPALNSCIREFYDPEMYNYLTFKNSCTQALTIVFVSKDGSGITGSMDLRPGGKDSVGRSAGGRVPKVGDFQLYVCSLGQVPVDESGKVVSKPNSSVQCQAKSK